MNCIEFLDSYSDYRDGLITDAQALRSIRLHVALCATCARYDESLRRGIDELGDIEPSANFRDRLRARLPRPEAEALEPVGPASAGFAASLMVAAAIGLLIYSRKDGELDLPITVATRDTVSAREWRGSFPLAVVHPGSPFVTFTELTPSPFRLIGTTAFHDQNDVPLGIWANLPH